MENKDNPLESMTEDQQMMVFNLTSIANIEDVGFAAQMLIEANYDVNRAAQKLIDIQNGITSPEPRNANTQSPSSNNTSQNRSNNNRFTELEDKYKKFLE